MLALPAATQAQTAWQASQSICGGCVSIGSGAVTYNSASANVAFERKNFPKDYLEEAFCLDANTQQGYGCDPDWIAAVITLGQGEPGHHPAQEGGYYAGRAYLIATLDLGKVGDELESKSLRFDDGTPGTRSFDCPSPYSGLQANTNYRLMIYAKPQRGRAGGWYRPLAWRDFRTPKHPDANRYCG